MCDKLKDFFNSPTIIDGKLYFGKDTYTLEEFPGLPEELTIAGGVGGMKRKENILNYKNIPVEFLPYALIHESFCGFIDKTGECVDSVEKELSFVPNSIKSNYIKWRIEFFEGMCNYAINNLEKGTYYSDLLKQMQSSLNYLKSLSIPSDTSDKVGKLLK